MVSKEEIERLAHLARLDVTEEEKEHLATEMAEIVSYVSKIQEIAQDVSVTPPAHRNILREDGTPHEAGAHHGSLVEAAPHNEKGSVIVPKVISND